MALAVLPHGDLIAGGTFLATGDGSTIVNYIARRDGSTWSALGAGAPAPVSSLVSIPATAALIGAVLHQQMAPVELDASGAITGLTSSNALTLTIGAY